MRDVGAGDAAGVEGTHRQLGTWLADRLGGNNADRVADLSQLPGRQCAAVTGLADSNLGAALQSRADGDLRAVHLVEALNQFSELGAIDLGALLGDYATTLGLNLLGCDAADQVDVRVTLKVEDLKIDRFLRLAVRLANNHVLGNVDEAAR